MSCSSSDTRDVGVGKSDRLGQLVQSNCSVDGKSMPITSQNWAERYGLYVANKVILKALCMAPVTVLWLTHSLFGSEAKNGHRGGDQGLFCKHVDGTAVGFQRGKYPSIVSAPFDHGL